MTPEASPAARAGARPSLFSPEARALFHGFLRRRLPDDATAEDILQQAYVKAWETRADTQVRNPTSWFYQVLRNAVADSYRERAAHDKRNARSLAGETRETAGTEPFVSDPEDGAPCECFKPLLADLRPDYAEILRLTDLEGRTPRETAARLGLTSGNTHVRLHRARAALRQRLHAACGSCADRGCRPCRCATSPTAGV